MPYHSPTWTLYAGEAGFLTGSKSIIFSAGFILLLNFALSLEYSNVLLNDGDTFWAIRQ